MKKKIVLSIYLLLIMVGINFQFSFLGALKLSHSKCLELLFAISLLGIYIIPGILLLKKFKNQLNEVGYILPLAIFSGFFVPVVPSSFGNSALDSLLKKAFGSTAIISTWSASLTAPFVEELIKLCCVLAIIYLLNVTDIKVIFLLGISVGFGFQIMEDISYIVESINSSHSIFGQLFARLSGSFVSHWAYTGVLSIGIISLFKRNQLFSKRLAYVFVMGPIIIHFLWNSPINELEFGGILLLAPVLSVITLLLVLKITTKIQNDLRNTVQMF